MIKIPYTEDHTKNQERMNSLEAMPCIVCGRAVKAKSPWMVRVFWGSNIVTDDEAAEIIAKEGDGGDLYYYPIGSTCLKNNPSIQPYARKSPKEVA